MLGGKICSCSGGEISEICRGSGSSSRSDTISKCRGSCWWSGLRALERPSALLCSLPGRCLTLKSNYAKIMLYRANLEFEVFAVSKYTSAALSVTSVKGRPYR